MPEEPTADQLKALESAAESLSKKFSDDIPSIVIEFAGSPKSGKSTTIDILTHFFKRNGWKVWAPTEGASKRTPYHLRRDLVAFNTWTLNYAVSELLVAYHNVDHHHLVIMDRGPFDSIAWMGLLQKRDKLDSEECSIIRGFALHRRWASLISRIYLFECDPSVSLCRENESKLTTKSGTAMNENLLKELRAEYHRLADELSSYPVKRVTTSKSTTPRATSFELAGDIVDLAKKKMPTS